jgi:RimJ/RimL family protein N-acetyltransferase
LTERPAELIAGPRVTLRRFCAADADQLVEAVNDTLDELRPWMPWAAQPATEEGMATVLREAVSAWDEKREFSYTIASTGDGRYPLVGCCGLHDRIGAGSLEIGYWVRTGHSGHGIGTEAASMLTRAALALPGVGRVEIRCDEANARSAAIPRKLGFRLERIERRPPDTPGETDSRMIWAVRSGHFDRDTQAPRD